MTSLTAQRVARHIVTICERLHARNMLAGADGNVSFRVSDDEILITPSGIAKGFMDPEQMAIINIKGETISGNPSSEKLMHLEVYKQCARAKAVVHAHPPTAIAWTVARPELEKLPSEFLSEVILAAGDIPFVPYARPGTADMGKVLIPYLAKHQAMILRHHGALTWGADLDEAYRGMERIEHSAQILAAASRLGSLTALPKAEVEYLYELRKKIGDILL